MTEKMDDVKTCCKETCCSDGCCSEDCNTGDCSTNCCIHECLPIQIPVVNICKFIKYLPTVKTLDKKKKDLVLSE